MFRWVQIWLDICLPALDDLNTIRKRDTAIKLLDQLRQDVTHKHDAYQRLESGYQRLWDFNDLPEYQEERIRLFQIVLGVFEPLTPKSLEEALRIQGKTYNRAVTTKTVKRLYSNFLYEDSPSESQQPQRELKFVHESARKFISNIGRRPVSGSGEDDERQFSKRNNHWTIARLYIDVVGLSTHPFWQANGLEPSNWTECITISPKADRLRQDRERWDEQSQSFRSYLARNGLRHCALAAEKRSMFDALWSKVLDNVVLNPGSALGFTLLVERTNIFPNRGSRRRLNGARLRFGLCLLRESDGHISLLPSHVLAILNIIHEDDVSRLRLTVENTGGTPEEVRQRRLFEHAACVGGDLPKPFESQFKATALHIACYYQNPAAVDMILRATELLSNDSVSSILFTRCRYPKLPHLIFPIIAYQYDYPIGIAIRSMVGPHIVKTLLKFERCNPSMGGVGSRPSSAIEPYISKQWSLPSTRPRYSRPVLHLATNYLREDEVCHLLSVARPEDINIQDWIGYTMLHCAARKGLLRLVRELVEKYDADIEAKDKLRRTPSYLAFRAKKFKILEYFKNRGANIHFEEDWSTSEAESEM